MIEKIGSLLRISFIFHIFSLCGYKEAATFKFVTEEEIKYVENFIRTKLSAFLDDIERRESCGSIDKKHFFGKYYMTSPHTFEFTPGERLLIIQMSKHVKSILDRNDEPNSGIKYFKIDETDKKLRKNIYQGTEYYQHFCGRFFTLSNDLTFGTISKPISENRKDMIADTEKLKSQLAADVQNWLITKSTEEYSSSFEDSMISVESESNGKIIGKIVCVFCKVSKKRINRIRVSLKCSDSRIYWILSNFDTHVGRCHAACSNVFSVDETDEIDSSGKNALNIIQKRSKMKEKAEKQIKTPKEKLFSKIDRAKRSIITDKSKSTVDESTATIQMSVEIVTDSSHQVLNDVDLEKAIYEQISTQILKLIQFTMGVKCTQCEMAFNTDDGHEHTLLTLKIYRDGHCMFRSLAHQLWLEMLGTKEQNDSTLDLRAKIVAYINDNLSSFSWELKGSVFEMYGDNPKMSDESFAKAECIRYLNEDLAKSAWGGGETIKALTHMYKVNVLVVNEIGHYNYPAGFNINYPSSVILAYRITEKKSSQTDDEVWESFEDEEETSIEYCEEIIRDHYDSVTHIEQDVILKIAKSIALVESKKAGYSNRSVIELDDD